jgi:3'5'-cyclic nucleotide phosphodiesterase
VDHPGVPNQQLKKEKSLLAVRYKEKSIAEQNSVDIAWDLFMKPEYADFRLALCKTTADMQRFRQIVVNLVMATDIMDQDLKKLRDMRWSKAFDESARPDKEELHVQVNRKATIVLEHLIAASDVSYTRDCCKMKESPLRRALTRFVVALYRSRTRCNIGISIASGTSVSLLKCGVLTSRVARTRIPATRGTRESWAFMISTLFPWPKS